MTGMNMSENVQTRLHTPDFFKQARTTQIEVEMIPWGRMRDQDIS